MRQPTSSCFSKRVEALLPRSVPIAVLPLCFAVQLCFGGVFSLLSTAVAAAEEVVRTEHLKGAEIYRGQCASCHGNAGEGVESAYPEPLIGDASVGELSKLISETMPEGEPEACVAEDATAVAEYIHYAFYSEAARIRNRPPRVSLARLTANQLRNSIADLYAHFEGVPQISDQRGIKGIYFDGDRWKDDKKKLERTDPVINFDFGDQGPGNGVSPKGFLIYWEGGIYPEVSGTYQITVRSTCSFTMDFGKLGRTFIDNHVQSGDKTEFRRTVYLVAGRVYPFKLQFVQRKRSTDLPQAKVSLSWTPPNQVEQIIPTRNLIPGWAPATYALQAELPADDRSYGFERGIAINRQWDDSTTYAALEFAQIAIDELWPQYLRKHRKSEKPEGELLRQFLEEIATVAFREPLSDEQRHLYIDKQVEATEDFNDKIKRSILIILKSPRFLYPTVSETASASQLHANLLTLTMFDSLPADAWLLKQVAENKLENEQQIRDAARRMVNDYRTRAKIQDMLLEWLNLSHLHEITKNEQSYPGFDEEIVSDLRASLLAQLDSTVWNEKSDFRNFFQSKSVFTTPRLAEFYGAAWQPAEPFSVAEPLIESASAKSPVEPSEAVAPAEDSSNGQSDAEKSESEEKQDNPQPENDPSTRTGMVGLLNPNPLVASVESDEHRFGILTHPLLMSGLAYHDSTSPIHRGVFLIRYMLGRTLRVPNEAFSPLSPDLHPNLTTRERVELQTSPESCQVCHSKINGLGFTLEHYDAVGRYRAAEGELAINAAGTYTNRAGENVQLAGVAELADYLATSEDAQQAFVSRAFQHFVKQPPAAFGADTLDILTEKFRASDYDIKNLIAEIAVIATTKYQP